MSAINEYGLNEKCDATTNNPTGLFADADLLRDAGDGAAFRQHVQRQIIVTQIRQAVAVV